MRAVEITNLLDEKISELAKNRLPGEPGYPSGDAQYASFMMPRDEVNTNGKSPEKWSSYNRSNGDDRKTKYDKPGHSRQRCVSPIVRELIVSLVL
jgi:hypothetical protein